MQIKTVGDKIAEARRKVGLTQQQLAERLCVTNKAVSKWERGASLPDVALLVPLSRILGYSVQQLLDNSANGGSDFPDDPSQRGSDTFGNLLLERKVAQTAAFAADDNAMLHFFSLFQSGFFVKVRARSSGSRFFSYLS